MFCFDTTIQKISDEQVRDKPGTPGKLADMLKNNDSKGSNPTISRYFNTTDWEKSYKW